MKLKLNAYLDKGDFCKTKTGGRFDLTEFNKKQLVITEQIPGFKGGKPGFMVKFIHITPDLTLGIF